MTQHNGRTALVTGGGRGMGEAISHRLARDGAAIAIVDYNIETAQAVASDICAKGGRAIAVQADITKRTEVERAVAEVRRQLGSITILVNNAGLTHFGLLGEITDELWNQMFGVNARGVFLVTQAVLPDMQAADWGRIVSISSLAGTHGAAKLAHYGGAKGAVIAMTKSLALELAEHNITVNAVTPGLIDTPMSAHHEDVGDFSIPRSEIAKRQPIRRCGRVEEIAEACAYFASEEAGYTTGQVLGVNGGTAM